MKNNDKEFELLNKTAILAFAFQTLDTSNNNVFFVKKDVQNAFVAFEQFKNNTNSQSKVTLQSAINECVDNQRTGFDHFGEILKKIKI